MQVVQNILSAVFQADSIWSVVARAVVWMLVAVVVIASADNPDSEKSLKNLKSNLGFLLMFLILSGGLVYLLFGYQPTAG